MRNQNHAIKYILSFFLVLTALFFANQHGVVAQAAGSDRVYYFNMDSNGLEGSMMLVQTNGHWGLVDAGHTSAKTIQDASGATYSTAGSLSSQVYCRNGKDVANYMINKLGVTHLDFVVGTHAHSDHVGGIPEVAAATYRDGNGNIRYLVDGNTTYYYKEYQHISDREDDLAKYSSSSWHNQAFAWQAANAMANRGANMIDVSNSELVVQGDPNNAYGDYVAFNVGNMSFRLYNVHEQTNTGNENVNSIVTVMTNGNYTVVNLADINTNNSAIDKTSQAIAKDYGTVDVVVAGHHGYSGSNTKIMFDSLQPDIVVVPNGMNGSWLYTSGDLAAAMPYAEKRFGTSFYNTGISYYATVTDLSGNKVNIYSVNANGNLKKAIDKIIKKTNKTGWVSWVQSDGTLWSYLEKGNSVKNAWRKLEGKYYRFDKYGIMQTGWVKSGKNYYYLDPNSGARKGGWLQYNGQWYYLDNNKNSSTFGKMLTGWVTVKNKQYYLDKNDGHMYKDRWKTGHYLKSDGSMATGWLEQNGQWYYLNKDKNSSAYGKRMTGWQTIMGKQYYLDKNDGHMYKDCWKTGHYLTSDGSMATGWLQQDGQWYYLNKDKNSSAYGKRMTGWQTIKGKQYYLDKNDGHMYKDCWKTGHYLTSDGSMATGWQEQNGQWYYLNKDKNSSAYGKRQTGWLTVKNKQYYLDKEDGHMYKDRWKTGHYLKSDGSMATGWLQQDGQWYYLNKDRNSSAYGKRMTGWQKIDGKDYYFYEDGKMASDTWIGKYYVNSNGAWVKGASRSEWEAAKAAEAAAAAKAAEEAAAAESAALAKAAEEAEAAETLASVEKKEIAEIQEDRTENVETVGNTENGVNTEDGDKSTPAGGNAEIVDNAIPADGDIETGSNNENGVNTEIVDNTTPAGGNTEIIDNTAPTGGNTEIVDSTAPTGGNTEIVDNTAPTGGNTDTGGNNNTSGNESTNMNEAEDSENIGSSSEE